MENTPEALKERSYPILNITVPYFKLKFIQHDVN